jgi:hypothetical protein
MKKLLSLFLIFSLLFSPCAWAKNLYINQKPPFGSQIDWSNPLSRGLIGCYLHTTNLVNGKEGTNSGVLLIGNELIFDGVNDIISLPLARTMVETSRTTVAWGIFPNTTTNYNERIGDANGWATFACHTTSDGSMYCGNTEGATNRFTNASLPAGTMTVKKWNHFVFTHGGQIIGITWAVAKFFKNGKLIASQNMAMPTNAWTTFQIGTGSTDTINGKIAYLYIWSRILSPSEIQALYIDPYCFIKQNYRLYAPAIAPPTAVFNSQIITVGW